MTFTPDLPKNPFDTFDSLNSKDKSAILKKAKPLTFDNSINKSAPSTVQVCRERTASNGCQVTMIFPETSSPDIRFQAASMLLTAFIQKRSVSE